MTSLLCNLGFHSGKVIGVSDEGIPINFEDWDTFYYKHLKCKRCGIQWKESILRYEYKRLSQSLANEKKEQP